MTLTNSEMEKKYFMAILFLWMTVLPMMAQPHLSEAFEMEEEWVLKPDNGVLRSQGMVGYLEGNILYCCHRQGFHDKGNGFRASVCAIDLSTGETTAFSIPLPEKKVNALVARKYWIRGICVQGERILLSVQNAILQYQKGKGNHYEFERSMAADLPDCLFVEKGRMAVVERVPEMGRFVFKRQGERRGILDSVGGWQLPGPFMLQYEPNGFVKQLGNAVYFLASPELRIEKYSLAGETLAVIRPELPVWKAIPDSLIQKISAMPYGSDRAMFTFFHTKEYSFPLEIRPLNDTMLMLSYHQFDTVQKKERVLTALVRYDEMGVVRRIEPYSHFFERDAVIGVKQFPLYYAQRELCLQVSDGDRLVQIVREAPVEWRGKTGREYADSVECYFAGGLPVYRVRVAKLRTETAERKCYIRDLALQTYEGAPFTGVEFSSSKVVFIVNNPPQCHVCEESLLAFLNSIDTSECKLCIIFNNADSYLAKSDQIENVRKHLAVPFVPLFVPTEGKEAFLKTLNMNSFPLVMTKGRNDTQVSIIPNGQIYAANQTGNLREDFAQKITRFLKRKGGAGK